MITPMITVRMMLMMVLTDDEDGSDKCDFNAVLEAETNADLDVGDGGDDVPFGELMDDDKNVWPHISFHEVCKHDHYKACALLEEVKALDQNAVAGFLQLKQRLHEQLRDTIRAHLMKKSQSKTGVDRQGTTLSRIHNIMPTTKRSCSRRSYHAKNAYQGPTTKRSKKN
ncbi:unnamed protein product [Cylindrotheca closterium]|uniref:Uncharacterized protein n=1 Tax=Cylindrotheca closterium TaxID=2856 RepID=A0AAD2FNQ5_9STRA|nr:unnamed protein product [Cylindrotheca closterium]